MQPSVHSHVAAALPPSIQDEGLSQNIRPGGIAPLTRLCHVAVSSGGPEWPEP